MSNDTRYRVISDLTEEEYNQQAALAATNPERHPPLLQFRSHHNHLPFDEGHISRIAADAYATISGDEPSDEAQQNFEEFANQWPFDLKVAFLQNATPHWLPPVSGEMSHWYTSNEDAAEFLRQHPEIEEYLSPSAETQRLMEPSQLAREALMTMAEMEHHPQDSADWQHRWNAVRRNLSRMAEQQPLPATA